MQSKAVMAGFALLASIIVTSLRAQEKLPYIEKSVWTITYVETKPGKFDDYIVELSKAWLAHLNRLQKDGYVLSHKIMRIEHPRDNEPNMILMVEYKNMAAFDVGTGYLEGIANEVFGSLRKGDQAEINREELRKLRGEVLTRELDFAK